ncbi:hypothetical protein ACH4UY_09565 [Streptomyces longwoodensis]|uniref:hypothetical protein n=1 Tax=Streptomyces longwoodensis TaxID=68231 RepID=UPI0037A67758
MNRPQRASWNTLAGAIEPNKPLSGALKAQVMRLAPVDEKGKAPHRETDFAQETPQPPTKFYRMWKITAMHMGAADVKAAE